MKKRYLCLLGGGVATSVGMGVILAGGGTGLALAAVGSGVLAGLVISPWVYISVRRDILQARKTARQLDITLRGMGEAVVACDTQGRLIRMNPAAESLLLKWGVEVVGQPLSSICEFRLTGPDARRRDPVANVLAGQVVEGAERLVVRRADGTDRLVVLVATPIREEDGVVQGAVLLLRDITAEHALEEQVRRSQRAESLAQLASGVAHDFNNLLQVVRVNLEFLADKRDHDAESSEYIGEIGRAASRAADLTGHLLALGRRQPLRKQLLDARAVVQGFVRVIQRLMGSAIDVDFEDPGAGLWVCGDRGQIEQVILNLCANARDAMPVGGRLTLSLAAKELTLEDAQRWTWARAGRYIVLTVCDTGLGMDDVTRARIFEPFFTTKGPSKGAGLGLSVVLGVIQQHQGFVHVDSRLGHGATFDIFLPEQLPPVDRPVELVLGGGGAPPPESCILVVEDEPTVRVVSTAILVRHGYRVIEASDGVEACELVRSRGHELAMVVMDVVMPRMGGFEAARRIAEIRPELPILLCTGCIGSSALDDEEHHWHVLSKPFGSSELLRALAAAQSSVLAGTS